MRFRYVVTYDICDDKRLRLVYRTMRGFGRHIQYSVFLCDLSDTERVRCESALHEIIHHDVDQVLFIKLGRSDRRAAQPIESVGRPFEVVLRSAVVA